MGSDLEALTWWRQLTPRQMRMHRRQLVLRLGSLSEAVVGTDLVGRALAGEAAAGLAAAARLDRVAEPDLGVSWVAWAAAMNHDLAILALVEQLELLADALEAGRSVDDDQAEADPALLRVLARDWRDLVLHVALAEADGRERLARLLEKQAAAERAMKGKARLLLEEFAAQGPETVVPQPSRQVVEEIGDTGRDGKGIAEAYAALTEPLRLAGGELDPDLLAEALQLEFPWLDELVASLRDELRLRSHAGLAWFRLRPLLLVGPPGVGKSRFAGRLARLAGTGHGLLSVAGSSDNRLLAGTARGWSSTQPAWPLLVMRRTRTANPVLVVDEVDKSVGSVNGDVRNSLLDFLEPETARAWLDQCLLGACDLSEISWILTANSAEGLPPALLSRLRVVAFGAPGGEHFEALLASVVRDLAEELGVAAGDLPALPPPAEAALRQAFQARPDVRRLKSAVARALASGAGRDGRGAH